MNFIDIIIAIVLVSFVLTIITYILGLFSFVPAWLIAFISVCLFITLIKFMIGRY